MSSIVKENFIFLFLVECPVGWSWPIWWEILWYLPERRPGQFWTNLIPELRIFGFRTLTWTAMWQPGQQKQPPPLRWLQRFSPWHFLLHPLLQPLSIHRSPEFDAYYCPIKSLLQTRFFQTSDSPIKCSDIPLFAWHSMTMGALKTIDISQLQLQL